MKSMRLPLLIICFLIAVHAPAAAKPPTVKVAVVQFRPQVNDVSGNLRRLIDLTDEAGRAGAKIVVHTEMATSGYSYFSREQIRKVAETIPGNTTRSLGRIANKYRLYVAVGLPEIDPVTNRFYNSAALIGPSGRLIGKYRKRSHLLESSWASIGEGAIPTFDTPYGRLAVVICADLFYPELARLAAIRGTDILLAPSNVGIDDDLLKVRTFENGFSILLANRYGVEELEKNLDTFTQETLRITSPFPYKFDYESNKSLIMTPDGRVLSSVNGQKDSVGYGDLPLGIIKNYPVERRPELYSLLGQDTLEPYTFTQLGLPKAGLFAVAAVDPGTVDSTNAVTAIRRLALRTKENAQSGGHTLKLIVFPANAFNVAPGNPLEIEAMKALASELGIDLIVGIAETEAGRHYSTSLLFTRDGQVIKYQRVHRAKTEKINVGSDFVVINRDYARIGLLQGQDLFAPESSRVLAKMGVDLIAVSADTENTIVNSLCRIRTADKVHLVIANRSGVEGVYAGGYIASPDHIEREGTVLMNVDTNHIRNKKELRRFDGWDLLLRRN
jgi:predicted amidohydrolase